MVGGSGVGRGNRGRRAHLRRFEKRANSYDHGPISAMSVRILCLFVPTLLWACSSPSGPNVMLLVQKPTSAEYSCLGVVGFEVSSTGAGKTAQSGPILNAAAVQTSDGCRLDHAFT